jgi:hypothetical protein
MFARVVCHIVEVVSFGSKQLPERDLRRRTTEIAEANTQEFGHVTLSTFAFAMENRPQKAHRTPHSGVKAEKKGKGKSKQSGFNEKVEHLSIYLFS